MVAVMAAMITAVLVADSMPSVTKTISLTLAAMLLLWAIPTSVIGVAVAAYLPPLTPLRDASVLGRRGVDFGKWTLAVAALFGTTMFGAMTSSMVTAATAGNDLTDAVLSVGQLLAVLAGFGAFFYWLWIPVDLWRAGRRRRIAASLRAANAYNRWAAEHDGVKLPPAAARLAAFAVRSASGIFFAFYTFAATVYCTIALWRPLSVALGITAS